VAVLQERALLRHAFVLDLLVYLELLCAQNRRNRSYAC
jgi:hypothetical protein